MTRLAFGSKCGCLGSSAFEDDCFCSFAEAAVLLLRSLGAVVEAGSFLVDLPDLGGRKRLEKIGITFHTLLEFAGE